MTGWVHHYVSTACLHGLCDERCRSTCKFCDAPCEHECHPQTGDRVLPPSWVDQARDIARRLYTEVAFLPVDLAEEIAADPHLWWLRGEEQPPGQWTPHEEKP
jgi:hypothetical protein